jgi:Concanavalin A-like lectin/glucanases superfamily/Immunoglobulin domain/Immunoglobulin I-set domain/Cohesin domain
MKSHPGFSALIQTVLASGAVCLLPALLLLGAQPVAAQTCVTPPSGQVGWWRAEGNAVDSAGGNNGVLSNGMAFAAGEVGQAFRFNGSNSFVLVPDAPALRLTNVLTAEFWVKRQQLAKEDYLINKGGDWTGGGLDYGVTITGSGNAIQGNSLTLNFAGGTRHSGIISDFNWHHCVVIATNGQADPVFYIDGVLQPILAREGAATLNLYPSTRPLQIGAQVDPASGWYYYSSALVDEVGLYSRALSSNEVAAIYQAGSAGKCVPQTCVAAPSGQVGWWKAEGDYTDATGNNTAGITTATFAPAIVGQGFMFNGNGQRVTMTPGSTNEQIGDNLTIEMWLKRANPTNVTVNGSYQSAEMVGQGWQCYGLEMYGVPQNGVQTVNGQLNLTRPGVTGAGVQNTQHLITDTNWHHVAVTRAGTNVWFYVDGVGEQVYYAYGGTPFTFAGYNFSIGAFGDTGGNGFLGGLDEVGVYNRVLSSNEIVAIYQAGNAGKCGVLAAPVITTQPVSQIVPQGTNVSLTVVATGAAPLGYQWYFNTNTPIAGATNATLAYVDAETVLNGYYTVVVSNAVGTATSAKVYIVVQLPPPPLPPTPPAITTQPASQTVWAGTNVTFTVAATGSTPLSYQWYFNTNTLLAGATNATLTLTNVQASQAGVYSVTVVNTNGSATSSNAVLGLKVPPGITSQPVSQAIVQGSSVTFTVTATGTQPLSYHWQKNGVNLADNANVTGSLSNQLVLASVSTSDAGSYSVVVANVADSLGSSNAVLTVMVPPSVVLQPAPQSVVAGNPASFTVAATGTGPLAYQWLKNGAPLTDGGNVSGSATTNLTLATTAAGDGGAYSVVVTNVAGSTVSSNAPLTVNAAVYFVPTNGMSGDLISVPVRLMALGQEIGVKFTVVYDPTVLTYTGVDDPTVTINTNAAGAGKVGLGFQNLSGFAAGDQKLVNVLFTANPVTSNTVTAVSFGDTPVGRQVIDNSFNVMGNVVYLGGTVLVTPAEYAGDVYPRPGGDFTVDLRDWAQIGRFVAGLDVVSNADELLRADCAPRGNPDGQLTVADWVEAGRYASGLDALTRVNPGAPAPAAVASAIAPSGGVSRFVQLANVSALNGQTVSVPVNLVAAGNENALGFNVAFDPAQLTFKGLVKGLSAAAAQMYVNSNQMASGRIGVTLALGANQTFAAGTNQLAVLSFAVSGAASGNVAVTFSATSPVVEQVVDAGATVLSASFTPAAVTVQKPVLGILANTNGTVRLSWSQTFSNFVLESGSAPAGAWNTNLGSPALSGTNLFLTLPVTNSQQFYRLVQ